MAHLHRLIVCIFALCCSVAFAAVPTVNKYKSGASPDWRDSAAEACRDLEHSRKRFESVSFDDAGVPNGCNSGFLMNPAEPNNWSPVWDPLQVLGGACPKNSTGVGAECICNAGTTEVGGECKAPGNCDGLAAWCSSAKGTRSAYRSRGDFSDTTCYVPPSPPSDDEPLGGDKFPGCNQGCMMVNDGFAIGFWDGDGVKHTQGEGTLSGALCTQSDGTGGGNQGDPTNAPTGKPDEKCAGFKGEVNGVVTCVPAKGAEGDGKTENKQNSDGTSSKTESKTKCEGGTCTTTSTTTNKDSNGVTTGTSTSVVVVSQGQYCAANPTSNVCAAVSGGKTNGTGTGSGNGDGEDESSFGGSCSGGWTCEGDAVQCAIAKEQHKRACELFVNETDESRLYKTEAAKDRNRDVTADLPGNEEIDVSGKLSQDDLLGGARCISDLNVTVWGRSVSLPLSDICPALGYMGWVLVAVASLAAFRIVSGSTKES